MYTVVVYNIDKFYEQGTALEEKSFQSMEDAVKFAQNRTGRTSMFLRAEIRFDGRFINSIKNY